YSSPSRLRAHAGFSTPSTSRGSPGKGSITTPRRSSRYGGAFTACFVISDTQVGLANGGVAAQFRSGATHRDAPILQHVTAIGDLQPPNDVLLDEENGSA